MPERIPAKASPFGVWRETIARDIRFAGRSLRRAPVFSSAVFATLILCIGPNTAILAVLYALVLKPLPFREPSQLVTISNVAENNDGAKNPSSIVQYQDFSANADAFEHFALWFGLNFTIGEDSTPERAWGARVTVDFFDLFGVSPLQGRFFTPEEQAEGHTFVLVLTQSYWEKKFNADPEILNRVIRMGDEPYTVVGIAPRQLEGFDPSILFYTPYPFRPRMTEPDTRFALQPRLLGRLKPGMVPAAGQIQLATLEQRFYDNVATPGQRTFVDTAGFRLGVDRLQDERMAGIRAPLYLLQGGALFVLLIGCVNVMNLWLARANAKRPEFAIRHALGAGRIVLLRQMLTESMLMTFAAAAVGTGVAWASLRIINYYLPLINRSAAPVTLEPPLLGWILLATLTVGTLVVLPPFQTLWRSGLRLSQARTVAAAAGARVMSGLLVVGQVAIALILLIGASLLIRSFAHIVAIPPGFDAAQIVQGRIAFPKGYEDREINLAAHQRALAAMKEIPGVETAAYVSDFAVTTSGRPYPFMLRGIELGSGESQPIVNIQVVSPDYFATMGIPLLRGRAFNGADVYFNGDSRAVIVDQTFAERYLDGRSPVGHEFEFGTEVPPDDRPWMRIVGVAGRAHITGLERRDDSPFVFIPINNMTSPGISLLLRTERPLPDVLTDMRTKLRAIDSRLPLYGTTTLQGALDNQLRSRRGITLLLGLFAVLALLLAAVGLYGVLAYDVSQRTHEIGIRAAIGATRGQILALIIRQGLIRCAIGAGVGLLGALYLTRFLRSQLFDVTTTDPISFVGVLFLLLLVALFASLLPALRASRVDPVDALRIE